jgi:hypothetical protein
MTKSSVVWALCNVNKSKTSWTSPVCELISRDGRSSHWVSRPLYERLDYDRIVVSNEAKVWVIPDVDSIRSYRDKGTLL